MMLRNRNHLVRHCLKPSLKIGLAISIIFFFSLQAASQNTIIIAGYVADDQTQKPIEGASIILVGTQKGASTNSQGFFELRGLPSKSYELVVSHIGYNKQQVTITKEASQRALRIVMTPATTNLTGVTVKAQSEEEEAVEKAISNVMPVTVITAKQIENRAGNLNEILARQAGVQIRLSGGIGSDSRISVRGLEGKRVQIFIDGNPLNTPDGSLGINDLPVQIIERIEIYKGSVPAYLGGDGLGSAVNVVFRHRDVSYIDASVARQSYNTQLLSLIMKKSFDKQGIEIGAGVFDTRSDNDYTMQSPFQKGLSIYRDHDKYHSLLAGGAIRFHKFWFDEVEIEGALVNNDKQIQGIQRNIQFVESRAQAGVGVLSLTKKSFANDKLGLRYNIILAKFNVKFIDTASYNFDWEGNRFPSSTGRGELGSGPNLSTNLQQDVRQRFNLDYRISKDLTFNLNNTTRFATLNPSDTLGNRYLGKNVFNYPASLKNTITGLTVEKRFKEDKVLTSAAIKHYLNVVDGYNTSIYLNNSEPDKLHNSFSEMGYTVGMRYNITPSLLAKASHERGVRLPNNTELFGDGILITPTTSLQPEIAFNNNVGAMLTKTKADGRQLRVEANLFYMTVDNLIQLSGNGLTLGYVNYAKALIFGGDVDVKYDVTPNLFASVNATYQRLTDNNKFIPGTDGVPNPTYSLAIPNTPQFFGNWNVEYHKTDWLGKHSKTRVMYDGSFVDTYNFGFKISIYDKFIIPGYLIHTLSLEQSFQDGRYTITGEVNNLTDQVIINNFNQPLPGRTFRVKLRYLLLFNSEKHNH
jgi:outer membrane cobalamin receptor